MLRKYECVSRVEAQEASEPVRFKTVIYQLRVWEYKTEHTTKESAEIESSGSNVTVISKSDAVLRENRYIVVAVNMLAGEVEDTKYCETYYNEIWPLDTPTGWLTSTTKVIRFHL